MLNILSVIRVIVVVPLNTRQPHPPHLHTTDIFVTKSTIVLSHVICKHVIVELSLLFTVEEL